MVRRRNSTENGFVIYSSAPSLRDSVATEKPSLPVNMMIRHGNFLSLMKQVIVAFLKLLDRFGPVTRLVKFIPRFNNLTPHSTPDAGIVVRVEDLVTHGWSCSFR
jgi:hypothetical protein